jgi:hypothetical protein
VREVLYLRVLRAAVDIAGGKAPLAAYLGVSGLKLESWLASFAPIPEEVFLKALDVTMGDVEQQNFPVLEPMQKAVR